MNDEQLKDLAMAVGERLQHEGAQLALAESCTGGWIAKACTDVAGSAAWFAGGWVSYSNDAKQAMLGVDPLTLRENGAVSEPVVREMARGAQRLAGVAYACAVSGIAGPTGGTDDKPVGLVWVAWAHGDVLVAERFQFGGAREQVRRRTVAAALEGLARV
ncbi:MAG: CinA family protein [Gammaproteobacteria bacterium]